MEGLNLPSIDGLNFGLLPNLDNLNINLPSNKNPLPMIHDFDLDHEYEKVLKELDLLEMDYKEDLFRINENYTKQNETQTGVRIETLGSIKMDGDEISVEKRRNGTVSAEPKEAQKDIKHDEEIRMSTEEADDIHKDYDEFNLIALTRIDNSTEGRPSKISQPTPDFNLTNIPDNIIDKEYIDQHADLNEINKLYPKSPLSETETGTNSEASIGYESEAIKTLSMNSTKLIEFWRKLIPNFNKILDHGCWCSALVHNKFPNTEPLDQLDSICHSWAVCRRCTKDTDSACKAGWDAKTEITEVDNFKYSCNAADDCTNGLCRCNMNFVVEISEFFNDYFESYTDDFEPDVVGRHRCGIPVKDEDLFSIHLEDIKDQSIFTQRSAAKPNSNSNFDLDFDIKDFNFDDTNHIEVPLDTDKIVNDNEFLKSFSFIDDLNIKEKVKNKVPSSMKVSKHKIKQLQALGKADRSARGRAISMNRRNEELSDIFGDPIMTGRKCCGHAPYFRLYNPNTDFCDEEMT